MQSIKDTAPHISCGGTPADKTEGNHVRAYRSWDKGADRTKAVGSLVPEGNDGTQVP